MKHGLVLFPKSTLGHGVSAFGWWKEAAERHGITLETAFFEDIVIGYDKNGSGEIINGESPLTDPDFVVMRGYNAELSVHFENRGVRVFNKWIPMMLCRDKILTHQILNRKGIPMPDTFRVFGEMDYVDAAELVGDKTFVVKATQGSCGENVYLVHDAAEYKAAISACAGECLFQKYIRGSRGRDIRVWTIGGKAVACVMRKSSASFRSNFSCGGTAVKYHLTHPIATLAERAANALGLDFAGVDILLDEDGPCVCEINGNAGFRTLSAVGGPDILDLFFGFIIRKVYAQY